MTPLQFSTQTKMAIDIVICIDDTGSMAPCIEKVKRNALEFYKYLLTELPQVNRTVEEMRIKVIRFGDLEDGPNAISESKFFEISNEERNDVDEYQNFINGIDANGGGDEAENALEALALAIKTKWTRKSTKRRHIIMLFTDAPALLLGARKGCIGYPENMPSSLAELKVLWDSEPSPQALEGLQSKNRRLLIYAPSDEGSWDIIGKDWKYANVKPVQLNEGGTEINIQDVKDFLLASSSD